MQTTQPGLSSMEAQLVKQTQPTPQPIAQAQEPQITSPIGSQQSVVKPPPFDPTTLDPSVVKVVQAIKNVESQGNYSAVGDNGSSLGAYQWNNGKDPVKPGRTPVNWQSAAKQYLGSAEAPMTPENQNYVAYQQVLAYKQKGLTPDSIDALWNGAKPDPNNPGQFIHINSERAQSFNNVLANIASGNSAANPTQPYQDQPKSLGGFAENVVQSGANFAGNLVNAAIHPIQTVQGLGKTVAGGLQELGGQQNENTQTFDAVKNYFSQRYGSPQELENSLYKDPIGVLGDLSAVLGVGGGITGVAGKAAEVGGLAETADVARTAASGLTTASEYTNPLTPIIKGAGAITTAGSGVGKNLASQFTEISPQEMQDIYDHPENYTPEAMANTTRLNVAQQVETALQEKMSELSDTGTGYAPFRETPIQIHTQPDYLDNAFRAAGVDVTDGVVSASSNSAIRNAADISKLQGVYNLYKSDFLKGTMDSNKFLNLRQDVADMAYNETGYKSTKLASAGEKIRASLNDTYRSQIGGLSEKDADFSSQIEDLKRLRKGFIDREGNLTQSAIAKIANAGNKDLDLKRLEELVPGITQRLIAVKVMKEIEQASGIKVGAYAKSITEAGGVVAGLSTGNLPLVAGSIALSMLTSPKFVVPLIRFLGENKELIPLVMAKLARFATLGAVTQAATQTGVPEQQNPSDTPMNPQDASLSGAQNSNASSPQNDTTQVPGYQQAIAAGYTPQEISNYLAQLK